MQLPKLNFEQSFNFQFRKDKDKFFIYDPTRKSWLVLTPEEWVRQHWIHYFLNEGYAPSALITEKKIEINKLTKRIDLLITKKTQSEILIECKAPTVKLTNKAFEQIARYNTIISAKKIILSNGIQHITALLDNNKYIFEMKNDDKNILF